MKTALITGITGQDGAYLAALLLDKGYKVVGAHRRSSTPNLSRLQSLGIVDEVELEPFELLEQSNIRRCLEKVKPDEIYNLAAQSFVGVSFEQPIYTGEVDGIGVAKLLESIRDVNPKIRFYQASSSEMFGKANPPQSEATPFHPRSPYGAAKLYAHWMTVNYREAHGLFASSGILFNHESPLRGPEFVTRKITLGLAKGDFPIWLGNLDAARDWGFAGDYVKGMWSMLQHYEAGDYVLATGQASTVRTFATLAAQHHGMNIKWEGHADKERGKHDGKDIFAVSTALYRPAEVNYLLGDASKAKTELGWEPKVLLPELASMMAKHDDKASTPGSGLVRLCSCRPKGSGGHAAHP